MLVIFANLSSCNGAMFSSSSKLISTFLNTSFLVLTTSSSLYSVRKCMMFSLPLLQSLQYISSDFPILWRCSLSPQCPVINPVMTRRSVLLIDFIKLHGYMFLIIYVYYKIFWLHSSQKTQLRSRKHEANIWSYGGFSTNVSVSFKSRQHHRKTITNHLNFLYFTFKPVLLWEISASLFSSHLLW